LELPILGDLDSIRAGVRVVLTNVFFIHTGSGQVATAAQLREAGVADEETQRPLPPWHPISGPDDASTMWYAVMRKRTRGVFIGTLCIRHIGRQASLEEEGWEEVPIEQIGVGVTR
jgi:hypothetical protein